MGHPLIEEFCRAQSFRPEFLRRCQREFREQVQPQIDERDRLIEEVARLTVENDALKRDIEALTTPKVQKRGADARVSA